MQGGSWYCDIVQEAVIKTIPKKKKCKKAKWLSAAKSLQLCLTLCDPIDSSPPGTPVPGILQARIMEWVAISFSNAWKWKMKVKSLSHVRLLVTSWTAAYQAPPSMGFSRQEYWSGVLLPSPMIVWGGLKYSWGKKRSKGQRRKGKVYPFESRVPKNSKER